MPGKSDAFSMGPASLGDRGRVPRTLRRFEDTRAARWYLLVPLHCSYCRRLIGRNSALVAYSVDVFFCCTASSLIYLQLSLGCLFVCICSLCLLVCTCLLFVCSLVRSFDRFTRPTCEIDLDRSTRPAHEIKSRSFHTSNKSHRSRIWIIQIRTYRYERCAGSENNTYNPGRNVFWDHAQITRLPRGNMS